MINSKGFKAEQANREAIVTPQLKISQHLLSMGILY